ncbi:MAG: dTDP-glucose 4,6-dehydratase [Alphaproteobacteria bacterium]|nr:dTDP-glucose 4,6-dehydratase [Alphaproteobacteria bacterium]
MTILVSGGCGFIGSNFIIDWFSSENEKIINLDNLTYAGNINNLSSVKDNNSYVFIHGDIGDRSIVSNLLDTYAPRAVINFAAESHVDRSIHSPEPFIETNIVGTFHFLEAIRSYWGNLKETHKNNFRFFHISTDEVYGSLSLEDLPFKETNPYEPNSVYSASKAASDHLVRAYYHTYGLPTLTSNCSNNYGPYQFPEKLIPLVIYNALSGKQLPIYGDGKNIRDWLFVSDHCAAIRLILNSGKVGETYNIGGLNEKTNLEVVQTLCNILDELKPRDDGLSYKTQISFVKDRAGHDRRYAIDATKIQRDLGWRPIQSFETGIYQTVKWYIENTEWVQNVTSGAYQDWIKKRYAV